MRPAFDYQVSEKFMKQTRLPVPMRGRDVQLHLIGLFSVEKFFNTKVYGKNPRYLLKDILRKKR
jgi:hypothetical protein